MFIAGREHLMTTTAEAFEKVVEEKSRAMSMRPNCYSSDSCTTLRQVVQMNSRPN